MGLDRRRCRRSARSMSASRPTASPRCARSCSAGVATARWRLGWRASTAGGGAWHCSWAEDAAAPDASGLRGGGPADQRAPAGAPWHLLYFLPEPQGQGALRPGSPPLTAAPPVAGASGSAASNVGAEYCRLSERPCACSPFAVSAGACRSAADGLGNAAVRRLRGAHARRICLGLGRLLHLDLDVEQEPDRLLLDRVEHRAEHVEALPLVLDQRVALRHRPQPDALLQVVHLVQVLPPLAVEHLQDHPALELAGHFRSELVLAGLVRRARVGGEQLGEQLRRQPGPIAAGLRHHVLDRERDRVERPQRRPQLVEVPVLRDTRRRWRPRRSWSRRHGSCARPAPAGRRPPARAAARRR